MSEIGCFLKFRYDKIMYHFFSLNNPIDKKMKDIALFFSINNKRIVNHG